MSPFLIAAHWEAKYLLNKLAFCSKSDTSLPLTRTGGIIGVFLLLENLFMIDQYVFGTVLGLFSFALTLTINLSLDPIISEVRSFAWKSKASLLLAVGLL